MLTFDKFYVTGYVMEAKIAHYIEKSANPTEMDSLTICFTTRKSKDNLLYLYLRVIINGVLKDSALHRTVEPDKWDAKAQRVRGNTLEIKAFNAFLTSTRTNVQAHYNIMLAHGMDITPTRLLARIGGVGDKEIMLLKAFKKHNDRMKTLVPKDFSQGTLDKYGFAYDKTKSFIRYKYKVADMELYKLNHEFVVNFEQYLKVHDDIEHNTTMKYISNLKKIVNMCVTNEWLLHNPFSGFKLTLKPVKPNQLTKDELQRISLKEFASVRLGRLRDIFLFCCYTGLAYSDVRNLRWADIQTGIDGKLWVIYSRFKNDNRAPVPLLQSAQEIIKRYEPVCADKKVFPVRSNQKVNEYLKEIAAVCGIDKRLHFHLARHTFATTVCLSNGVPIETTSKMLGHKSLKYTQIYARVVDQKIANDMQNLSARLDQKSQDAAK